MNTNKYCQFSDANNTLLDIAILLSEEPLTEKQWKDLLDEAISNNEVSPCDYLREQFGIVKLEMPVFHRTLKDGRYSGSILTIHPREVEESE